jgi:patatin-like phospholipase/acyl hydrolase
MCDEKDQDLTTSATTPTSSPDLGHRPRILVLDGLGIRGLGSLLILKNVMARLSDSVEEPALPFQYFDLIGRAGMGGLIAIMLGRLEMVRCPQSV